MADSVASSPADRAAPCHTTCSTSRGSMRHGAGGAPPLAAPRPAMRPALGRQNTGSSDARRRTAAWTRSSAMSGRLYFHAAVAARTILNGDGGHSWPPSPPLAPHGLALYWPAVKRTEMRINGAPARRTLIGVARPGPLARARPPPRGPWPPRRGAYILRPVAPVVCADSARQNFEPAGRRRAASQPAFIPRGVSDCGASSIRLSSLMMASFCLTAWSME